MSDVDLAYTPMTQLRHLLDSRQVSSLELTELYLRRIEALNPKLNVLPTQLPDAIGDEPASDYLDFKEQPGLPFDRAIHLAS